MNPLLVREVQPPLIYVGGDGRLNNTQSIKSIYYFFCVHLLLSLTLVSFFLVLRSFFALEGSDPRGSRGERIDLGQPIAAALPDGVPPGGVGFLGDRGKGVPSFDEMMDIALVEVDFDDPTTNVRGRRALAIAKPTPRGY